MTNIICRTCLSETSEQKEFISLFKQINIDENKSLELCKMLLDFTGIECKKDDGMPDLVCRSCTKEICSSYFFRKKSLVSQALLKNEMFDCVKEEDEVVEIVEFTKSDSETENNSELLKVTEPIEIVDKLDNVTDNSNSFDNCISEVEMLDHDDDDGLDYDIQYIDDENNKIIEESDEVSIATVLQAHEEINEVVPPEQPELNELKIEKLDNFVANETDLNVLKTQIIISEGNEINYICEFCGKNSLKYETYRVKSNLPMF